MLLVIGALRGASCLLLPYVIFAVSRSSYEYRQWRAIICKHFQTSFLALLIALFITLIIDYVKESHHDEQASEYWLNLGVGFFVLFFGSLTTSKQNAGCQFLIAV